jgi:hypothetical protein
VRTTVIAPTWVACAAPRTSSAVGNASDIVIVAAAPMVSSDSLSISTTSASRTMTWVRAVSPEP